jgi:5'-nucleotidase
MKEFIFKKRRIGLTLRATLLYICAFITVTVSAQTKEITILAVNDMHAAIDRFPKFVALVDSMRTIYPDLLLISAGDNRTGNPVNDMHPDSYPVVELMNRSGFNLSLVGNHEFDGDIYGMRSMINNSNFRYICANMVAPDSLRLHVEPYKFFETDGIRIGILGLLQLGANGLPDSHPDKVRNITFRPAKEVANQYMWLRNQSDVFIMLVHELHSECVLLANLYPSADVLISGHSHRRIDTTEIHNGVLLTQADSQLRYVTHITIQLTDGQITKKESRLLDVNAFSRLDADVQAMVDEYNNNEALRRVLTQAITDFEIKEELGNMMTDAIRVETGADIALQNPGGVRFRTFPKGAITIHDIYRLDPFNNEIVEFYLTGEEVLRLIKAAHIAENKQPPYVSGITYEVELDNQRNITNLQVKLEDGSPLNLQRSYKVVLNSYLAAVSQFEKTDPGKLLFRTNTEVIVEHLEKQPAVDYQGVKRVIIKN